MSSVPHFAVLVQKACFLERGCCQLVAMTTNCFIYRFSKHHCCHCSKRHVHMLYTFMRNLQLRLPCEMLMGVQYIIMHIGCLNSPETDQASPNHYSVF